MDRVIIEYSSLGKDSRTASCTSPWWHTDGVQRAGDTRRRSCIFPPSYMKRFRFSGDGNSDSTSDHDAPSPWENVKGKDSPELNSCVPDFLMEYFQERHVANLECKEERKQEEKDKEKGQQRRVDWGVMCYSDIADEEQTLFWSHLIYHHFRSVPSKR